MCVAHLPSGISAAIRGSKSCARRVRPAMLRKRARDGSGRSKRELPRADGLVDLLLSLQCYGLIVGFISGLALNINLKPAKFKCMLSGLGESSDPCARN